MSERHKGRGKDKPGLKQLMPGLLRRTSPAVSQESLRRVSRRPSPLPQDPVAGPSSSAPASARSKVRSPNPNTTLSRRDAFQTFLASGVLGPLKPLIDDIAELFEAYKDTLAADSEYAALQMELEALLNTLKCFTGDNPVITELIDNLRGLIKYELDNISGRETEGAGRRFLKASEDLDEVTGCYRRIHGHVNRAVLQIISDFVKIQTQHENTLSEHKERLDGQSETLAQHEKVLGEQTTRLDGHGETLAQHENVLGEQAERLDAHGEILGEHTKRLDERDKFAEEQARVAKEKAIEEQLEKLKPSLSACYKSSEAANLRRECTPNTRKDVLSHLDNWRRDPTQGNIFWMNGMAGTGKTTIANSLCTTLKSEQKLGASFFCTRTLPECRSVKLILPTIAYQLSRFSAPFRDALSRALKSDPDLRTRDLPTQLEGLILGPLREIIEPIPSDVVIVIDALDECEERAGVEEILGVLMAQASALPVKVFVSSRPEEEVRKTIGDTKSQVVLHELDRKIVKEDIGIYLREELKGTSVSDDQLAELVDRAGVLFIFAATVARFINAKASSSGQQERLKIVLRTSSRSPSRKDDVIDALYSAVLQSAFNELELEDFEIDRMRDILHTVVCAQEPLTADALAGLLNMANSDLVLDALEPLWSVVHVSGSGGTSLITTLHASFPDYMFDEKRSKKHCCNVTSHHGQLAELCLARIESNKQQFNICELESSYVPDAQVPDLEERIKNAIPIDLLYSCQYWAVHLELGGWSADRMQLLKSFLSKRLLLWMEVLNLKKRMNFGAVSLEKARKWCTNGGSSEAIVELVHDAWRFVTMFATSSVSRSTPHIYVSMLASWPSSKLITDYYASRASGLAEVKGSRMKRRQLALLGVFAVRSMVWSVAFSPDGMHIICGDDSAIHVWDAQSGKVVLGPLKGHTYEVSSVAFSPDGQHIVSGSRDKTVRLWDAQSGKGLRALESHKASVTSVAFSPDGARIVSGSEDKTARVWDLQSGKVVRRLKVRTAYVNSVAFSPDGTRIVCGSSKMTILVRDSQSGQVVLGPLEGHTHVVNSVAFSPDGNQIVSGGDQTIRVWDARNGKPILKPLEGHTDYVTAVAFSPDGSHIVSGSYDKSVRVWDARRGNAVLGPLEGHTNWVTSVAFSPDGMRIVSGSLDQTICVWDAQIRDTASEPFEGHTEPVHSVSFSPDGTLIVSGSVDTSIRVWDAQNGNKVTGALLGHTRHIASVAFSPDGLHVVSGSWDNTLRLWDVRNEKVVLGPLKGHIYPIKSVAFSPDGMHIVSGSNDATIRMWDAQNGKTVLNPLKGHTGWVNSVAFSPNGMFIVSGSNDKTLRVWGAQNGEAVLGPLKGHTRSVNSVAFSPNGMTIVSGSEDSTLRVWDAQSGNMVLAPLEGHTGSVSSVAFSPDGGYIASGSVDKTIRVWTAQTGELALGPLNGHTLPVRSVSFSPDSTHIVSGSDDMVIRVWRLPSRLLTAKSDPHSPATPPSLAVVDSPIPQPRFFHQDPSNALPLWMPNEDGWVVDKHGHLWLWVPPDLRSSLMTPINPFLISTQGSVELNFDSVTVGESWADCYTPS